MNLSSKALIMAWPLATGTGTGADAEVQSRMRQRRAVDI